MRVNVFPRRLCLGSLLSGLLEGGLMARSLTSLAEILKETSEGRRGKKHASEIGEPSVLLAKLLVFGAESGSLVILYSNISFKLADVFWRESVPF